MKSGLKELLWVASAIVGLSGASLAHAGGRVYYSLDAAVAPGVNLGVSNVPPQPVYLQPAPVYVAPQPVYVQPPPVYVQPPVVVEYEGRGRREHWEHERRKREHWEHEHEYEREHKGGHREHEEHGHHRHED
ncbi:hypothetical protein [Ramlibacter sp.]|uniref:hypothetical protein n=1 Tax=Ramlibacter sp. TaxID=1917967 RepID=UPI00261BE377|nr:hypothetical protein [Ramlibacter sp.]MDB5956726.1 hypothetical protein [Ramlibacter sp.]